MINALQDIFTPSNTKYLLTGLFYTILVSVVTVGVSTLFGTVLALLRNYERRFIGKLAGAYIEIFRNTPLLLWIMICLFVMRFGTTFFRGTFGLTLYTSSVVAEIIRGGLNSIDKGQFEAAQSQGFGKIAAFIWIILPQTFIRVVPSLMSQVVTTIKDTSFLSGYAIAEMFYRSKVLLAKLPGQGATITGTHTLVTYGSIALIYFAVNFSLSCIVRLMMKRTSA
ncbi:MAG: amino acid ABC transporter permease [Oscillospiraceae bacterium]|jgi:putative glutamine transport system permease protein|nr:amino acid ABC transporter permease [Oscillospiraceae bacterium]